MTFEQTVIQALTTALSPTPVRYLFMEQDGVIDPPRAPYCVVARVSSNWIFSEFCGQDINQATVVLQVDFYDWTSQGARTMADVAKVTLAALHPPPVLDLELDFFEPDTRLCRTSATYIGDDSAPLIAGG